MITIAARAAEERLAQDLTPFRYTIIMTKTDKIDNKKLRKMVREIKETVVDSMSVGEAGGSGGGAAKWRNVDRKRLLEGVSVIPTSSVSRVGAEQVWELIYNNVVKKM